MRFRPEIERKAIRQFSFDSTTNGTAGFDIPAVADHVNVIHWIASSFSAAPTSSAVIFTQHPAAGTTTWGMRKDLARSDYFSFDPGLHNNTVNESVRVRLGAGGVGIVGRVAACFSVERFDPDKHSGGNLGRDAPVANTQAIVTLPALADQSYYIDFLHCSIDGVASTLSPRVGIFNGVTPLFQVEVFPIGIHQFNKVNLLTPENTEITAQVEAPGVNARAVVCVGFRRIKSDPNARDAAHKVGTNRTAGVNTGTAGVETRAAIRYFHTSFDQDYAGAPTQITINETGDSTALILELDETVGKPFSMNFPVPIVSARGVAHALTQTGDTAGIEGHSVGFQ